MRLRFLPLALLAGLAAGIEAEIAGDAAAPIRHQALWRGEAEVQGYHPAYLPGTVSFDLGGRAVIRSGATVQVPGPDDRWECSDLGIAVRAAFPAWDGKLQQGGYADEHIGFDADGDAYTLVNATRSSAGRVYLLHSRDRCRSWTAYELCIGYATIEHRDGFSDLAHPPAVLLHDGGMTGLLRLALPGKRADGTLAIRTWTLSDDSFLVPNHSGAGNSAISRGGQVHVVWPGRSPRPERDGTPQYAATFERATGRLGEPVLLGFGGHGEPDNHNLPAITADREGYLHVVLGAHHDPFLYRRSLAPGRVDAGWSEAESFGAPKRTLNEGSYTYAGWMCDPFGNLHCIARWAGDGYFMRLVHLRKPAGGAWEPQRLLVQPFSTGYSVYHHKPSLAPDGRLFVAYHYGKMGSHPSELAAYARKYPERDRNRVALLQHPVVLTSADQGASWRLASSEDLAPGVFRITPPATPAALAAETAAIPWPAELRTGGRLGAATSTPAAAFVANGTRVLVVPAAGVPAPLAAWTLPGAVEDLAVADGRLLVAVRGTGLEVYAPAGAAVPRRLAGFKHPSVRRITLRPGGVALACDDGVRLVDLGADGTPRQVAAVQGGKAAEAVQVGGLLYVARGAAGLEVVDIADPAAPRSLGMAFAPANQGDKGNTAWSVAVAGGRLLTAPGPNPPYGLRVLDLADPRHPAAIADVGHTPAGHWGWGRRIRVQGGAALVAAEHGLAVVAVAGARPVVQRELKLPKGSADLAIGGDGLLVADGAGGLLRLAAGDPATAATAATWSAPRTPTALSVDGDALVVTDWEQGVQVHPLGADGSPGAPAWSLPLAGQALGAVRVGDRLYVAQGAAGLGVYALAADGGSRSLGAVPCGVGARAVARAGAWLAVAEAGRGICLLRPGAGLPEPVADLPIAGEVLSLAGAEGVLYAGLAQDAGRAAVVAYALSPDGGLRERGRAILADEAWGLWADGDGCLAACAGAGLWRLALPEGGAATRARLATAAALPATLAVAAHGGVVYSAHGSEGLAWARR